MTRVSHFGVHWDGPVGWLLQNGEATNALGFKQACPISPPRGRCNHAVPAADGHYSYGEYLDDPLFRAMLPVPRENRLFFLSSAQEGVVHQLSQMSSPLGPVVFPAWAVTPRIIQAQMHHSNVQPWVITQVKAKDHRLLELCASLSPYAPRTVVFVGGHDVPVPRGVQPITTRLRGETQAPWELIGATALRRYLRKEPHDC